MLILALNCGSSSVKFKLFDWEKKKTVSEGAVERIGIAGGPANHQAALRKIITSLAGEIAAVGHRVVHGGEKFKSSVLVTDEVLAAIKAVQDLAPLHNPPNIAGIEAAKELLPKIPQVAIFDTAFHQTLPEHAYLYAVPYEWYEMYRVRRYGFHGTSHYYVSRRAAALLGKKPEETNLITMHIGNGVSVAAIKNGASVDTSMGLTPLEGAVMGTRCGDVDSGVLLFLLLKLKMTPEELETVLNRKSGLLGITGKYMDRRDIEKAAAAGDRRAQLAIEIESYRLKKYIGAYAAALGRVDAVVFTAGAGELDWRLRQKTLTGLENLGIKLDPQRNEAAVSRDRESVISTDDSPVKVLVIPTDEEKILIEEVVKLIHG